MEKENVDIKTLKFIKSILLIIVLVISSIGVVVTGMIFDTISFTYGLVVLSILMILVIALIIAYFTINSVVNFLKKF